VAQPLLRIVPAKNLEQSHAKSKKLSKIKAVTYSHVKTMAYWPNLGLLFHDKTDALNKGSLECYVWFEANHRF